MLTYNIHHHEPYTFLLLALQINLNRNRNENIHQQIHKIIYFQYSIKLIIKNKKKAQEGYRKKKNIKKNEKSGIVERYK